MKHLLLSFFLTTNFVVQAQHYVDMTSKLSNINGNLIIDGNSLKTQNDTREEIIIRGKNLKLNNNSGIILNNVIVQLSGDIIIEEDAKVFPKLIDSYILCKSSEQWNSKHVITTSNYKSIDALKVKHIKKLKGNPKIIIFDATGKIVYKGKKDGLKGKKLSIARYDMQVEGQSYQSKLLFL